MNKYVIIVLSIFILGSLASLYMNWNLLNQRKELQNTIKAYQESIIELKESIQKQAEVLSERETRINKLANDKYKLNKQLQEAINNEKEVKEWADTLVPSAVNGMLKDGKPEADCARAFDEMLRNSPVERQY